MPDASKCKWGRRYSGKTIKYHQNEVQKKDKMPYMKNNNGDTAFALAAKKGLAHIVRLFLNFQGLDRSVLINTISKSLEAPLSYALDSIVMTSFYYFILI